MDHAAERILVAEILLARKPRSRRRIVELAREHDVLAASLDLCPYQARESEGAPPLPEFFRRLLIPRDDQVQLLRVHDFENLGTTKIRLQNLKRHRAKAR